MYKSLFGWIASGITVIYKMPQIVKLYRTKKSTDLSTISLWLYILHLTWIYFWRFTNNIHGSRCIIPEYNNNNNVLLLSRK